MGTWKFGERSFDDPDMLAHAIVLAGQPALLSNDGVWFAVSWRDLKDRQALVQVDALQCPGVSAAEAKSLHQLGHDVATRRLVSLPSLYTNQERSLALVARMSRVLADIDADLEDRHGPILAEAEWCSAWSA